MSLFLQMLSFSWLLSCLNDVFFATAWRPRVNKEACASMAASRQQKACASVTLLGRDCAPCLVLRAETALPGFVTYLCLIPHSRTACYA